MSWQDMVFSVGGALFTVALIISIRKRQPPFFSTCMTTGCIISVFSGALATLDLYAGFATNASTAVCWFILARIARSKERLSETKTSQKTM